MRTPIRITPPPELFRVADMFADFWFSLMNRNPMISKSLNSIRPTKKKGEILAGVLALTLMLIVGGTRVASASLVEVDLNTTGDALLTRDTSTGLEWLDVTQTYGLSYDDVIGGVGNTWLADGWTYATPEQIGQFFTSAGWDGLTNKTAQTLQTANSLLALWGVSYSGNWTVAIHTGTTWNPGSHDLALVTTDGVNPGYIYTEGGSNWDFDTSNSHALIRSIPTPQSSTPLPPTVALFPVGVAFMEWRRRRKAVHLSTPT